MIWLMAVADKPQHLLSLRDIRPLPIPEYKFPAPLAEAGKGFFGSGLNSMAETWLGGRQLGPPEWPPPQPHQFIALGQDHIGRSGQPNGGLVTVAGTLFMARVLRS